MFTYRAAINYTDYREKSLFQQGNRDDVSRYSFDELMKEIQS